jgi:CubicO group peptidase (beta-lactamase class C family)
MTFASAIPPGEAGLSLEGIRAIEGWMRGYVDAGLLPGALNLVARHGNMALLQTYGSRYVERGAPVEDDTIFRIYSMTKPVTAVAALILFEEGALGLDDPVARSIPSFENLTVDRGGNGDRIDAEPLAREMTVRHLLTHTSGLSW